MTPKSYLWVFLSPPSLKKQQKSTHAKKKNLSLDKKSNKKMLKKQQSLWQKHSLFDKLIEDSLCSFTAVYPSLLRFKMCPALKGIINLEIKFWGQSWPSAHCRCFTHAGGRILMFIQGRRWTMTCFLSLASMWNNWACPLAFIHTLSSKLPKLPLLRLWGPHLLHCYVAKQVLCSGLPLPLSVLVAGFLNLFAG